MKMHRSVSSVVHHHALGHNISLSGHHTKHLLGNPTFEIRKLGWKIYVVLFKENQSYLHCKDKANPERHHIIFLSNALWQEINKTTLLGLFWDHLLRIIFSMTSISKENILYHLFQQRMIKCCYYYDHFDIILSFLKFLILKKLLFGFPRKLTISVPELINLSQSDFLSEFAWGKILLSCTLFQSCTFWQRYPTTNAQDKSSSAMVGRHLRFPPALRCDLLDAPLSLWWWRNRSCTFSSLKKRRFLKQKPMLSLPLKNWLLFLAILIKA